MLEVIFLHPLTACVVSLTIQSSAVGWQLSILPCTMIHATLLHSLTHPPTTQSASHQPSRAFPKLTNTGKEGEKT